MVHHSKSGAASGYSDNIFRIITLACGMAILIIMAGVFWELVRNSRLSITKFGFGFITSNAWNPVTEEFGAAASIFGTMVSTLIAMVIAVPLSLAIALFLAQLAPPAVRRITGGAIELLAAVPSIIYGMWGLFVFAPVMADHVQPALQDSLGFLPLFQGPPMGIGMLTAGLILALMIIPFISSVARDIFEMVPIVIKESAYAMGATTWEVTRKVIIPYGLQGIMGACFLGLSRALGETMAITFVIGNDHTIGASLFASANSIASTLANEFTEASEPMYLSALIELGLVLFAITFIVQILAELILRKAGKKGGRIV
ncbi:MAG: phosphate ABC transporter permease subunit PstC [Desulfobacteraceae bacterium 4484_190.1]|nr:MAG: phosphate ABC transporter permease subunit PstC [Desulfobacteraceae bacterium 4484_190.1]